MIQRSASTTSVIWLAVRFMSPQKIELCWAMRNVAKAIEKMSPRYLARSPVSIFRAMKCMAFGSFYLCVNSRLHVIFWQNKGPNMRLVSLRSGGFRSIGRRPAFFGEDFFSDAPFALRVVPILHQRTPAPAIQQAVLR